MMNKQNLQYYSAFEIDGTDEHVYHEQSIQLVSSLPLPVSLELEDAIISYALRLQKPLSKLNTKDFTAICEQFSHLFLAKNGKQLSADIVVDAYQQIIEIVKTRLEYKLQEHKKSIMNKVIVHTAPHHDDIVLGYHPFAMDLLVENKNHILYLTNGYHGVSDEYVMNLLATCLQIDKTIVQQMVFENFYQQLLEEFAQAFREQNNNKIKQTRKLIFLKIIVDIFGCTTLDQLEQKIIYLHNISLGSSCLDLLKGRLRQSESDSKWMILQGHTHNVTHFGASFYDDDSYQAIEHDAQALAVYFQKIQPDVITVALDPCGVGPTTHFTSLQLIAKALQKYDKKNIKILGYRNVWSAFTIAQTSIMVPVSDQEIDLMSSIFLTCFATQKEPLFPSPLHDGPFSKIVTEFMQQQGQDLSILLAKDLKSDAYLFLRILTVNEFLQLAQL